MENIQHDPPTEVKIGTWKVKHANNEPEITYSALICLSVHDIGVYFYAW